MSRSLALVLACLLAACGGKDPAPEASSPSAEPAPATPADPASDPALAAKAKEMKAARLRPIDPDKPSGRMVGAWAVSLTEEQKAQYAEAKATIAANPDDAAAAQLLRLVEGMLGQVSLDVTPDMVRMRMGEQLLASPYRIVEDEADHVTLTTTEPTGKQSRIRVAFEGDVMVWTKAGEKGPMRWERREL